MFYSLNLRQSVQFITVRFYRIYLAISANRTIYLDGILPKIKISFFVISLRFDTFVHFLGTFQHILSISETSPFHLH